MGDKHNLKDKKELQPLLVFGPPTIFPTFEAQNSHNYRFLKAFSSQFPLLQFLTEQKVDPSSIQAIFCNPIQKISADVIRLLPSLRIIVTSSAGTDHIDLVECSRHGIQVVTAAGDHAGDVADMALGLLLDVMGKISAADRHVRKWGPSMPFNLSFGSKVLLILLLILSLHVLFITWCFRFPISIRMMIFNKWSSVKMFSNTVFLLHSTISKYLLESTKS